MHAENPSSGYQESSIELITKVIEDGIYVCIDGELDSEKSKVLHEYVEHVGSCAPGTASFFLQHILEGAMIVSVSDKIENEAARKAILQLVSNKRDRTFLRVAFNSANQILASNDFQDFQKAKRKLLKKKIGVKILCGDDYMTTL
jgi:hypothetical protein